MERRRVCPVEKVGTYLSARARQQNCEGNEFHGVQLAERSLTDRWRFESVTAAITQLDA